MSKAERERQRDWIGVDLDKTLAYYDRWQGVEVVGEPIPAMLQRVKDWIAQGKKVKIFTARVSSLHGDNIARSRAAIEAWCVKHIGVRLEVTCEKDGRMLALWDDRCVQMNPNTGEPMWPISGDYL